MYHLELLLSVYISMRKVKSSHNFADFKYLYELYFLLQKSPNNILKFLLHFRYVPGNVNKNKMSSIQPPAVPPAQSTVTCDGCDAEFDVTWFCKVCPASLCDTCKQRHESDRFLKRHTIVKRTGNVIRSLDVSKIIQPCSEHPEREITMYCKDCLVACCITCFEEKHDRHSFIAIEKKYMEREDELNEILNSIEKSTLTKLRANIDDLQKTLGLQETEFEKVQQRVDIFRKELKTTVDRSCDKLLDEIEQKKIECKSEIESVIKDIENEITANENFISACSAKIREGGMGLIGYNPGVPPPHDKLIPQIQMSKPEFVPGRDLMEMITSNIGKIEMMSSDSRDIEKVVTEETVSVDLIGESKDTCTIRDILEKLARLVGGASGPSVTPRDDESKLLVSREKLGSVSAQVLGSFQTNVSCKTLAVFGKGTALVGDWHSNTIYLYDESGRIVKSVEMTSGVWGLALNRFGKVIVCSDDKKIRLVTGSGKVSTLADTLPFRPRGVYLTTKEEIVVCMAGKGEKNHVAVYSMDGKSKLREITMKDKQGRQMLTDPVCVVMNGEDFSVLNNSNNVVTFDQSGKVRWVYDGSQADREGRFVPLGLCADKFCNLLISDWGRHCVHYVNREGVLIQLLLTQEQHGIQSPWGIGVDNRTGQVWVGNDSRTVWVVKYLHT